MNAPYQEQIKVTAPGRICLFGDHQDYLGLPVIACAINRSVTLRAVRNHNSVFSIKLPDINHSRTIYLTETFEPLLSRDYLASSLRVVKRYGCIPSHGYDITIQGTIPMNAGVSSSSALVVAWVHFLLRTFGCNQPIDQQLIAQLAFEAEVLEHQEPGGKMDQFTSSIGNILFIETGTPFRIKTIGHSLSGMILSDSGISKKTIDILTKTKEMTLESIHCVQKKVPDFTLEQVQLETIDSYLQFVPDHLKPYFKAAVKNHSITLKALVELEKEQYDLKKIGQLMNDHHEILKNVLKVTVPKIDRMIEVALQHGAYGTKIVGSGGGGCIVVLSPKGAEAKIIKALMNAGAKSADLVSVGHGTKYV